MSVDTTMKFYKMNGIEDLEIPIHRDPMTLSPHQKAVWDSVKTPKLYKTLYRLHKGLMPESSVRRIMNSLLAEELVKRKGKQWVQTQ